MKHSRGNLLRGLRNAIVIIAILGAVGAIVRWIMRPKPTTVKFIVWHTENDKEAQGDLDKLQAELKRQVEAEWRATGEHKTLDIYTQYVPWGQLAMKLSAVKGSNEEPNLTHLEPYMTAAFHREGRLYPIEGILTQMTSSDGSSKSDAIMPSVARLQQYGDHTYGIAYAVGATFYSYRKDWTKGQGEADLASNPPRTWDQLLAIMPRLQEIARKHQADNVVLLPGGDPFFLDQFFGETLASFSGSLFRRDGNTFVPNFESAEVSRTLTALHRLSPYLVKNWSTVSYLDQYQMFGKGRALLLPVTYARATAALTNNYTVGVANDSIFGVLKQPGEVAGGGKATIDCEDWVVLRRQEIGSNDQVEMREIARKYLQMYYGAYYLPFTSKVPVHLTPIFSNLNDWPDGAYWKQEQVSKWLQSWRTWAIQSQEMLSTPGAVNPILMSSPEDNQDPLLFECQKARIITDMVQVALRPSSTPHDIELAQHDAQRRANDLARLIFGQKVQGGDSSPSQR